MVDQSLDTSPLEVSLSHAIASGSISLIRTRWVAGMLVLLATIFCVRVLDLPLPEVELYFVGVAILLYNGVLVWLTRRIHTPDAVLWLNRTRQIIILQVALDWLSMAIFLHLTGGICSPAIPFLLVHMLMAAFLLPGWLPYLYVALGMGMLALIASLEWVGILPHYVVIPFLIPDLHTNPVYVGAQLLFVALTAFTIVFLVVNATTRLYERERRISILLQTTRAVSATLDLSELLEQLARSAAEALSVQRASIRLLDETSENLKMAAAHGLSQAYLEKGPVDLSGSAMDSEALAGHPVVVNEAANDPRIQYPRQVIEEGIQSMLAVPIIGRGKPLGILRVYSDRPHHFSTPDADFAMAIAHQGATALENALAYESLQKADQARTQFVQMVTHELRAPVAGSQSLIKTLLRGLAGDLTDQQEDILARIRARLDLLMEMINDLLDLAASKTIDLEQPLKRLPLQPILRQVVDRFAPEAESKQIELALDIPFEVLAVRATEDGLIRVFNNLLGNAIKYTPPNGRVCVRVVERLNGAVITVSDTGMGIPAEDLPRLWNNFFRARNARQSGIVGTGLGLSIVKELIDHFGGLISVRSTEGEGTTFKVTLPLASPADEAI